jgi:hypothetical protein
VVAEDARKVLHLKVQCGRGEKEKEKGKGGGPFFVKLALLAIAP